MDGLFRADSVHGKTWGQKGQPFVVERPGPAAVDQCGLRRERTGRVYCTLPGRTERRSVCLAATAYDAASFEAGALVLDGLPAHRTTLVKTYVASTKRNADRIFSLATRLN